MKEYEIKHRLFSKDWKPNTPKTAEATTLLDLVETIVKRIEQLLEGLIIIYNDNKRIMNMIYREIEILNVLIQDAAAQVVRIRELL